MKNRLFLALLPLLAACGGAELNPQPQHTFPGISVDCSGGDVPWFSRPATLVGTQVRAAYAFSWDNGPQTWTPTHCATTSAVYSSENSNDTRVPLTVDWRRLNPPRVVAVVRNGVINGPDGILYLHFLAWDW